MSFNSNKERAHIEEEVRAAVFNFAATIGSPSRVVADMSALARVTANLPLSNFAYWEQFVRNEFSLAQRRPVQPAWLARVPMLAPRNDSQATSGRLLTWIDLCSFDGHLRERALRALAGPAPNAFFLALAARRLNDWVPQVRSAARAAMLPLARDSDPEHVADVLCAMLPTWTAWGRAEMGDRQTMMELLSIDRVVLSLKQRLTSEPAGPMSAILSQVLRSDVLDDHLVDMSRHAIQPAVRAKAHRTLLAGKAVWLEGHRWEWTDVRYCRSRMVNVLGERAIARPLPFIQCLNSAASDRSSVVRRVAAEVLVSEMDRLGPAALPVARRLAADVSPRLAERAEFVLKRLEAP
jgi:hypothetical protein